MSDIKFIRISDGATVTSAEACDARGVLKSGFGFASDRKWMKPGDSLSFDVMLFDGQPTGAPTTMMITDAQVIQFRDSPQGREFLAFLRSSPTSSHPSAQAMTADAENAAIRQRLAGGPTPTVDQRAAHAAMETAWRANDPNAWRNTATS